MENRQDTAHVLTDFSVTFDTVNRNIMIRRLQVCYSIVSKGLAWLQPYVERRNQ